MEYIYLFLNVYIFIFIFLIYIFDEKSKMLYGYFMKKQSVYDYKDTISDVDIDSLVIPSSIKGYLVKENYKRVLSKKLKKESAKLLEIS